MSKYPAIKFDNSITTTILPVVVMMLLTVIIYSNTLHCAFVFDDHQYITEDRAIRITELSPDKIINAAINGKPRHRLLPNISFAINYYFGRYRVYGYHLVNIAIHIFTGIFLFFLFRTTLGIYATSKRTENRLELKYPYIVITSMLAACLWLAHPVQTQAVTYIVQRMTSMAAMFYILSLLLYALGRQSLRRGKERLRAWIYFIACVTAGLCAIASKENTATLPVMIMLYEWFFFQELKTGWSKKQMLWILAAFIFVGTMALIYLGKNPLHRIFFSYSFRDYTLPQRVMTEFRVLIYYIGLLFIPRSGRLALHYNYPLSYSMLHPETTMLSLVAIIALIVSSVYLARKKYRLESFCILWFFITLFIESSVISIEIIYEHRLYLASMIPVLFFCVMLTRFARPKWLAVLLLCGIIGICGIQTYQRNKVWNNPVTLWSDNFKKFPNDGRVLNNLGLALMNSGKTGQAIDYFKKCIQLKSSSKTPRMDIIDPLNNLATAYIRKKKFNKAIKTLETAIQINPLIVLPHINIAVAFQCAGRYDKAIIHYKKALKIDAKSSRALTGLAEICLKQGNPDQAAIYLKTASFIDPENISTYLKLARAFIEMDDYDKAMVIYTRALKIEPENDVLLVNLGNLYAQKGRLLTAVGLYRKALQSNPKNANAGFSLAIAYAVQKDYKKAISEFKQMLLYNPNNPNIYYNIACLNALQNNAAHAVAWLKKAVSHGYINWEHIKSDPDLENIRTSKAYQNFVEIIEKTKR